MMNFATSAAGAIPSLANEVAPNASMPAAQRQLRRQRIRQLREAIDSGQYHVAAGDLADALLRAARQAN